MSSILEVNTKLEAYKLIHDPARLLSLLYSKYGDIEEDYYLLYANQVVYNKLSHFNTIFKESQFSILMGDFLKRLYKKYESIERIPKLSEYYKNYHTFFCKPTFRNIFYLELMHNYQENKAEIFYKNNYKDSNNNINNTEKSFNSSSSLSSLDNITNNKTIFTHRNKKIIDDNLDSKLCTITLTLDSIKNSGIGLISTRSKGDSFEKAVYNIVNYKYNKNKKNEKTKKKANTNVIEKRKNKIGYENLNKNKNNKNNLINKAKNVISQISYKNINNKTNKIKYSLYTLAKKNYSSNKNYSKSNRPQSQSKNNIFLSAKNDAHFFSKVSKLEEFNKNKPVIIKNTNHKRNKTFNVNNQTSTIHNEINNNYSNYNCFSKLSATLNKNKLNITNNTNYNSNSNSHNTIKTSNNINNKSIKMSLNNNDQFFALNNGQQYKHKKYNTFEINNQKIIICSSKLSPNNTFKKGTGANYQHGGSKFNLVKGTIADIIKKPNCSNNQLFNKYFNNVSKKNMFSNASSSSIPKFNILSPKLENNKNNKESKLYYMSNNNSIMNEIKSSNISNKKIMTNNLNISNIKHKNKNISRFKKNNASYINNNFNINFNNVIFCGNRISSSSKDTINFNSASNINNNNTNITKSITSNGNISQNCSINNNSTAKNKLIRDICLPNLKNIYIDSRNKHKIQIGSLTQNPTNTKSQSKISKNAESKIIIAKEQHKHINSNLNSNHQIHNSKNVSKKKKKDYGQKIALKIEELISKSKKSNNFKNYNSNNIKAKAGHKAIVDNNRVCLKNNKSFQKDKKKNSSSKTIYSSTTSIRGNLNKII